MVDYGSSGYWDARYAQQGQNTVFEWYFGWAALKQMLPAGVLRSMARVVVLGCGNSALGADMVRDDDGSLRFGEVLNVDYSRVVIHQMQRMHAHIRGLRYDVMDVRNLKVPGNTVDLVLDKGTLDAVLCGAGAAHNASLLLDEAHRVLVPGGVYLLMTYGNPETRTDYLKRTGLNWTIESFRVEVDADDDKFSDDKFSEGDESELGPSEFYIYICTKTGTMGKEKSEKEHSDVPGPGYGYSPTAAEHQSGRGEWQHARGHHSGQGQSSGSHDQLQQQQQQQQQQQHEYRPRYVDGGGYRPRYVEHSNNTSNSRSYGQQSNTNNNSRSYGQQSHTSNNSRSYGQQSHTSNNHHGSSNINVRYNNAHNISYGQLSTPSPQRYEQHRRPVDSHHDNASSTNRYAPRYVDRPHEEYRGVRGRPQQQPQHQDQHQRHHQQQHQRHHQQQQPVYQREHRTGGLDTSLNHDLD